MSDSKQSNYIPITKLAPFGNTIQIYLDCCEKDGTNPEEYQKTENTNLIHTLNTLRTRTFPSPYYLCFIDSPLAPLLILDPKNMDNTEEFKKNEKNNNIRVIDIEAHIAYNVHSLPEELMITLIEQEFITKCFQTILAGACGANYSDLVQYMYTHRRKFKVSLDNSCFKKACRNGHLEMVMFIWEIASHEILDKTTAFKTICGRGDLRMVKWFKEQDKKDEKNETEINKKDREGFIEACFCGRTEIVVWLMKNYPGIDHRYSCDNAFRSACTHNHLETAKTLKELDPEIDHRSMNDWAFRNACEDGYLELAQWLWSMGVNVRAVNNYAYRQAKAKGRSEVVGWLEGLEVV